jgi:hypothetical protein
VHRLAAKYLDTRQTWRENQGEQLVTVCIEVRFVPAPRYSGLIFGQAAKLHPCLYDYDGFWPVHDHLKRHLVSTRNKYSYLDPDLVALHDAEAVEKGEPRPPRRKKRQIIGNQSSAAAPRSPLPSLSAPDDLAIDMAESFAALQQQEPLPSGHPHPTAQRDLNHHTVFPLLQRAIPQQAPLHAAPAHVQHPQRFEIQMGNPQANSRGFLMSLYDKLVAEGHPLRHVSILSQLSGTST